MKKVILIGCLILLASCASSRGHRSGPNCMAKGDQDMSEVEKLRKCYSEEVTIAMY